MSHRSNLKERVVLAPSQKGSFPWWGGRVSLGSKLRADVCSRLENSPLELVGGSGDSRVYEPKRNLTELPGSEAPSQIICAIAVGRR